jgi:hypothetical protein
VQHLTEALVASRIEPGTTLAHRRGSGIEPSCKPAVSPPSGRWIELSAGRAQELGAVECPECTKAVAA